jgi:hypothetical protein
MLLDIDINLFLNSLLHCSQRACVAGQKEMVRQLPSKFEQR